MEYRIITVVFTKRKLSPLEMTNQKRYKFVCNVPVKVGDLIDSPVYSTTCQVVDVRYADHIPLTSSGQLLKDITVDSINGKSIINKSINEMKPNLSTNSSMFDGIMETYASQYMPEKEEGVRLSMTGLLCVPVGDSYVGCDANNKLTRFPKGMTFPFPVYSIAKPVSALVPGDIIKRDRSYAKFLGLAPDGRIKTLSYRGVATSEVAVEDFLMQQASYRVLINMFNFDPNSGFNPIVYAVCTGEQIDTQGLMMLSMMPQGKALFANSNINPMMFMFLDKNRNGGGMDPMGMMMMASMMGGMQGQMQNPFANMFGQLPFGQQPVNVQPMNPQPVQTESTTADDAIAAMLSDPETRRKVEEALKK